MSDTQYTDHEFWVAMRRAFMLVFSNREFWLLIRRALLMICKAIEKRYCETAEEAG